MRTRSQRLLNEVQRPEVYREVLVIAGRHEIALSVWEADAGAPTVVFLPGTMTHPLFYEDFLDGLAQHGIHVVGVHYPNHGKSPRSPEPFRFEDLVTSADVAVHWAQQTFGTPIVTLGSSQGGMVALALAIDEDRIAATIAHNVVDPASPETLRVTRFPQWLEPAYHATVRAVGVGARLAPRLPVPVAAYLDLARVCTETTREQFDADPLGLHAYPVEFLASLMSADLRGMFDGRISRPVTVVAATGDPLFPFESIQDVFDRLVAPTKELVTLERDCHLIFNDCVAETVPVVAEIVRRHTHTAVLT